jgi:hypothetical protein
MNWPLTYRWALANGVKRMLPWHFLNEEEQVNVDAQFKRERTDSTEIKTFAYRQDCDDFAGFIVKDGRICEKVVYFHPSFNSGPNEDMINSEHDDFWDFFREVVIPDTREWTSEEDLEDLSNT